MRLCSGGSAILEAHLERAALEPGATGTLAGEGGGQDDSPLFVADRDHELGPDLLQADVAALGEWHSQPENRAAVDARDVVGELRVQNVLRCVLGEELPG